MKSSKKKKKKNKKRFSGGVKHVTKTVVKEVIVAESPAALKEILDNQQNSSPVIKDEGREEETPQPKNSKEGFQLRYANGSALPFFINFTPVEKDLLKSPVLVAPGGNITFINSIQGQTPVELCAKLENEDTGETLHKGSFIYQFNDETPPADARFFASKGDHAYDITNGSKRILTIDIGNKKETLVDGAERNTVASEGAEEIDTKLSLQPGEQVSLKKLPDDETEIRLEWGKDILERVTDATKPVYVNKEGTLLIHFQATNTIGEDDDRCVFSFIYRNVSKPVDNSHGKTENTPP